MGFVIAVVVVVVVVGVVSVLRRRRGTNVAPSSADPTVARAPADAPAPMTDLESALARVTDRDGRPIGERIEAESAHLESLRDPEDTGPLLRRALDSVAHPDDAHPDDAFPADPARGAEGSADPRPGGA